MHRPSWFFLEQHALWFDPSIVAFALFGVHRQPAPEYETVVPSPSFLLDSPVLFVLAQLLFFLQFVKSKRDIKTRKCEGNNPLVETLTAIHPSCRIESQCLTKKSVTTKRYGKGETLTAK